MTSIIITPPNTAKMLIKGLTPESSLLGEGVAVALAVVSIKLRSLDG